MSETKKETIETFKGNLKKSNKSIQATRANRLASVAKMEYDNLVNGKRRDVFNLENDLEAMADISASNVTTTSNAIKGAEFDALEFVKRRAGIKDELILCQEELKTLVDDAKFYG